MMTRWRFLPLAALAFACGVAGQSNRISGIVHPSLPSFQLRVNTEDKRAGLAEGFEPGFRSLLPEFLYLVSANGCEYALEGAGENYFGKNDGILPPVQDAFGNCGY